MALFKRGGALELGLNAAWTLQIGATHLLRKYSRADEGVRRADRRL
jgi:hypothetical protein